MHITVEQGWVCFNRFLVSTVQSCDVRKLSWRRSTADDCAKVVTVKESYDKRRLVSTIHDVLRIAQHDDVAAFCCAVRFLGDCYGFVVDQKADLQVAEVLPNLLLSSQSAAADRPTLTSCGVTHILCVAPGIEPSFPGEFTYFSVPILDLPNINITDYFPKCFQIIDDVTRSGGRILVHCNAGVSRAVSVVIGYLIELEGMDFDSAFALVKSKRPASRPNDGFTLQLKSFSNHKIK